MLESNQMGKNIFCAEKVLKHNTITSLVSKELAGSHKTLMGILSF